MRSHVKKKLENHFLWFNYPELEEIEQTEIMVKSRGLKKLVIFILKAFESTPLIPIAPSNQITPFWYLLWILLLGILQILRKITFVLYSDLIIVYIYEY